MKKFITGSVFFLLAVSFVAAASAEDVVYEGTMSNMDAILNTFKLKTKSADIDLYVRPMSHLKIDGENKSLASIPYGSEAKCTTFMKDDRLTVRECIVTPKK